MEIAHDASPSQLYRLAVREKRLAQNVRNRLTPDFLFVLALTDKLRLSQCDKDRLDPVHLAHLALVEKITLNQSDRSRLPVEWLAKLDEDLKLRHRDCPASDLTSHSNVSITSGYFVAVNNQQGRLFQFEG